MCFALYRMKRMYPDSRFVSTAFNFWFWFRLPYISWVMVVVRTHFFIDLFDGIAVASLCCYGAEKISYLLDVKLTGRRADNRQLLLHQACPSCGWSNQSPLPLIDSQEKQWQIKANKGRAVKSKSA